MLCSTLVHLNKQLLLYWFSLASILISLSLNDCVHSLQGKGSKGPGAEVGRKVGRRQELRGCERDPAAAAATAGGGG
jgi:hypothetical protein